MVKFNDVNIECSFIQNLLLNFHIPTIRIFKQDDYPYKNEHYIKGSSIFTYRQPTKAEIETGKYIKGNYYEFADSVYEPGKEYRGLTRNLISESNNYNTPLHEALGNYLRFIKDFYDIDLMPLYNCFSNRFIDTFSLPITDERRKGSPIVPGTKLFAFPVKFGHKYSIFCKNNCVAYIQPTFFDGKRPLEIKDDLLQWVSFTPQELSISQWEENIYELDSIEKLINSNVDLEYPDQLSGHLEYLTQLYRHNEINLYLLVQIPNINAQNIVVIEDNSTRVLNNSLIQNKAQIPFSDKLLGYLLDYYITPITTINENIYNIQKILSSKYSYVKNSQGIRISNLGRPYEGDTPDSSDDSDIQEELLPGMKLSNYNPGVFDYSTRDFIYNLYRFRDISDFTGYVDKDVEQLILNDKEIS